MAYFVELSKLTDLVKVKHEVKIWQQKQIQKLLSVAEYLL